MLVALRGADLRVIGIVVVLAHLPMAGYWRRRPPNWLDTAWEVSGALLGLVLALIIFLLQAANQQSLRSESTFRAILRRTHVLWPVMSALAFVIAAAFVSRIGDGAGSSSGALETYALVLFVAQVAMFGGAIFSAIRVVSPEGVSDTIIAHFRDGVFTAVEHDLAARVASNAALEACEAAGVTFSSFLASGWPIDPIAGGWVIDIDRELPAHLAWLGVAKQVTLTAQPGAPVSDRLPLARATIAPKPFLAAEVRRGMRVTRNSPPQPPREVFDDAVDLARRSLQDGGRVGRDLAIDLLATSVAVYADAYALFGIEY